MASAHAARNAQAKRGAANEDHNTLLTALIHEGGIQQKKETWKGALDKARYKNTFRCVPICQTFIYAAYQKTAAIPLIVVSLSQQHKYTSTENRI